MTTRTDATTAPRELGYDEWMRRAAGEYDRLGALLDSLGEEDWARPTDCVGWDVRAVVAHLVGAAAAMSSPRESLRQAVAGRRLRRGGDLVDAMNEVQVRERAHRAPAGLRADLAEGGRRAVRARSRIPAALRAVPMPFGPPLGTKPLGHLMGRIYTRDAWMHRVDISRATGRPLVLEGDHDGRLVEDVVAEWARRHGAPYALELTGPAGGRWATQAPGTVSPLVLDAVEFCRTVSGRAAGQGLLATRVPF